MKLSCLGLITTLLLSSAIHAQVFEITPSYGYQFGARLGYGPNYIQIEDSDQYGFVLGYEIHPKYVAELTYTRMNTELRIRDTFLAPRETDLADINADWFFIGTTRYFQTGQVKPFFGTGLGLAVFTPENENQDFNVGLRPLDLESSTRFAFSLKGGVNLMLNEIVGVNLQGNLYFPVNWAGAYIGPNGVGISTGSTVILGGFSAGFTFRLGDNS